MYQYKLLIMNELFTKELDSDENDEEYVPDKSTIQYINRIINRGINRSRKRASETKY